MSERNDNQSTPTFEGHSQGRDELKEWKESQPSNAYVADTHFQRIIYVYSQGPQRDKLEEDLHRFGGEVATVVDDLVQQNNLMANRPRLNRYTGIGERTEQIEHHPTYHDAGEYIYGSGMMSAYEDHPNSFGVISRMYLSCYNGEAGHNCPAACTAGVIRVLQELADDELREKYLPGFLDRDYENHLEGAQFLTEIQGGSDVGANATKAVKQDDDTWRIYGEKWFCSNIDADVFLMTARYDDDKDGTSGLGLFFVPRELDDGSTNHFHIRRLKEKIGTRSMASAEVDFRGTVAYSMGDPDDGFKNMMNYVINTSRLFNAAACTGLARRAYVEAQTYAQHRSAFDGEIGDYPLIQETLANMKAEVDAMTSATMHMSYLQDQKDADKLGDAEKQFMRMTLNLNKIITAKSARWTAVQGIEVLGGNGAIETFSVLPRLLRDSIVTENWEGTHNTLMMQIMRDMKKYGVHEGFSQYVESLLEDHRPEDGPLASRVQTQLQEAMEALGELQNLSHHQATLKVRPLTDRLAYITHAAIRLWERAQSDSVEKTDTASIQQFIDHRLDEQKTQSSGDYLERISSLSRSL
jgi:alkylation response protein AidB-like acyl-CoA dehydrogenase